jgi:hypothetical protein
MAGEVIAVGEDVKKWRIGDRVCANFFLDKLNDVQTPETDESALGGTTQGVLTEYRTFPAHVCSIRHLFLSRKSDLVSSRSSPFHGIFRTRKRQPYRDFSLDFMLTCD